MLSWAQEVATTPLRVNLFDPGVVATRLRAEAMPGEDRRELAKPEEVAGPLADLCDPALTVNGQIVGRQEAIP